MGALQAIPASFGVFVVQLDTRILKGQFDLRKIKRRLLDTAYAATHLDYHLTTEEQIAAEYAVTRQFNLEAERLGWGVRFRCGARLELVPLRPGAINKAASVPSNPTHKYPDTRSSCRLGVKLGEFAG